jgi:osmotically-inducible protein OsmY
VKTTEKEDSMANRNDGQDFDDRSRNWGRDRDLNEGRGSSGRDWGAGERGWGHVDMETQGGREGRGGGRSSENEGTGRERGVAGYGGRDVDWRSDWQQQQQGRGGYIGTGGGQAGGMSGNDYIGGYGGGYGGDRTTSYGTYSQGQGGQGSYGSFGQGQSQQGQGRGYGQSGGGQGEGWSQGPHTGRGPQGYQRSNERIKEEVCEVLTRHGQVDASHINIRVENGEVTLEGTVETRREKRLAEEAVEHLSGVKDVHNQLRVGAQQGNGGTQQETSAAHQAGLQSGGGTQTS